MKIKIPVKEVQKKNHCDTVREILEKDSENAYTISGLMVEAFGVSEKDINNKPFRDWPKGLPTMYSRINACLTKFKREGFVKTAKDGKAWVYWWSGKN